MPKCDVSVQGWKPGRDSRGPSPQLLGWEDIATYIPPPTIPEVSGDVVVTVG